MKRHTFAALVALLLLLAVPALVLGPAYAANVTPPTPSGGGGGWTPETATGWYPPTTGRYWGYYSTSCTTGTIYLSPAQIMYTASATKVGFMAATASRPGSIDIAVAVYDVSGALVEQSTTGAISAKVTAGTGNKTIDLDSGITLDPGRYWLALSVEGGTWSSGVRAWTPSSQATRPYGITSTTFGGVNMPATVALPVANGTGYIPSLWLE